MTPCTVVWFRQDLRLADNPALFQACQRGCVLPIFIWSPEEEGSWPLGGASEWWLHHSLHSLAKELDFIGLHLTVHQGDTLEVLNKIIAETGATAVYWNRRYEPAAIAQSAKIKLELHKKGIETQSYNAALLFEPWTVANKQGKPYQVFTPFWKCCATLPEPPEPLPIPQPHSLNAPKLKGVSIDSLSLLPKIPWDTGIKEVWQPGCPEAQKQLSKFTDEPIHEYNVNRDLPNVEGVSKMSPYLHFGEISPRTMWHGIINKFKNIDEGVECYLKQLGWREFAHHLLFHFPKTPELPLRQDFLSFPWKKNAVHLKAWQQGHTGYPFVDAGMRQLWHTGWMHNRVRMVVGSFLVKHLLITWVEGAKWFWDTLVDADLANNTMGWQWVGGCGADAAPYFRIFNPITQGEKFDPNAEYIRHWVPEIAALPNKWIHTPWEAPELILRQAGVVLGKNYPRPIVDHAKARVEALAAFSKLKEA